MRRVFLLLFLSCPLQAQTDSIVSVKQYRPSAGGYCGWELMFGNRNGLKQPVTEFRIQIAPTGDQELNTVFLYWAAPNGWTWDGDRVQSRAMTGISGAPIAAGATARFAFLVAA